MKKDVKKDIDTNKNVDKKKKINIVFVISLILFIILTILVFLGVMKPIDDTISSFIIGIRNTKLTDRMINISNIGGGYSLISISLLLLIFIKKKKIPLMIIINLVIVFLSSQLLKIIFRRPRPDGVFLINRSGFSYPSGHAMVSLAYVIFIVFILKNIKNKFIRIMISSILIILAILIGFSRIYLGVHYFSDVLAGFIAATCYISIFISTITNRELLK